MRIRDWSSDVCSSDLLAGLAALPDDVRPDDFVLVHDAARPNLSAADLDQLLERGRGDPVGAILAAPARDTLNTPGDDGGTARPHPRRRPRRPLKTGGASSRERGGHDV